MYGLLFVGYVVVVVGDDEIDFVCVFGYDLM